MGYFAPLIASLFLVGFLAIFAQESRVASISSTAIAAQSTGQSFLAYRNAVMTYQQNNPTFLGTIPAATIAAIGGPFSASFLTQVSNVVVSTGIRNGRVVICYGPFTQSVAAEAAQAANNDASFGVSNGATWTSAAIGAPTTAMPLVTTITAGNVLSVIQMDL